MTVVDLNPTSLTLQWKAPPSREGDVAPLVAATVEWAKLGGMSDACGLALDMSKDAGGAGVFFQGSGGGKAGGTGGVDG